jgi:hypothetical protein
LVGGYSQSLWQGYITLPSFLHLFAEWCHNLPGNYFSREETAPSPRNDWPARRWFAYMSVDGLSAEQEPEKCDQITIQRPLAIDWRYHWQKAELSGSRDVFRPSRNGFHRLRMR